MGLAGIRVSLVKKGETWLVTDAEVQEPVRAGTYVSGYHCHTLKANLLARRMHPPTRRTFGCDMQ